MSHVVVIATAVGPMQANLIKSQLEAHNIPVMLSQESAGAAYGFTVGTMGLVDILVAEEHAAEARTIIKESNIETQDPDNEN